jgi:hypothetical protein
LFANAGSVPGIALITAYSDDNKRLELLVIPNGQKWMNNSSALFMDVAAVPETMKRMVA